MNNITYADLAKIIDGMTDEQKNQTATVFVTDVLEFYPIVNVAASGEDIDILDPGHVFFEV